MLSEKAGDVTPLSHFGIAVLAMAVLIPGFVNVFLGWFHNPLQAHGLLVPGFVLLLVRQRIMASGWPWMVPGRSAVWVLGIYALAFPPIRAIQLANPDWRAADWALAVLAVGVWLLVCRAAGGRDAADTLGVPALVLLVAVPWPTRLESAVMDVAMPVLASVTSEALLVLGIPAADAGRVILTVGGPIAIAEDCGGIRSFHLVVVAVAGAVLWFRLGAFEVVVLNLAASVFAFLLNMARTVAISVLAVQGYEAEYVGAAHDYAGWIAHLFLVGAIWWCCKTLAWRRSGAVPGVRERLPMRVGTARFALAFALAVLAGECAAQAWFWDEGARRMDNAPWAFLPAPQIGGGATKPIPAEIRRNYRFTDAKLTEWRDDAGTEWSVIWVGFKRGDLSSYTHNVHRPEACLPAVDFFLEHELEPLDVGPVQLRHQVYRRGGQSLDLFYVKRIAGGQGREASGPDWTWAGRIRAALGRARGTRAELLYITASPGRGNAVAREQAAAIVRSMSGR